MSKNEQPEEHAYTATFDAEDDSVKLRVPTGDDGHCWHGLDLATAKRLRNELCEAVDKLDAVMDYKKSKMEDQS